MNCKVCHNQSFATGSKVSYFRFPSDKKKCLEWVSRCNLMKIYNESGHSKFYNSYRICSNHFNEKQIYYTGAKRKLFYSAVPEVNLTTVKQPLQVVPNVVSQENHAETDINLMLVEKMCRLCAEEHNNMTDVFGFRGKYLQLLDKLAHLPIEIISHDVLPTKICQPCISKVTSYYYFIINTIKADKKLKIILDMEDCDTTYQSVNVSTLSDPPPFAITGIPQTNTTKKNCTSHPRTEIRIQEDQNEEEIKTVPHNKEIMKCLNVTLEVNKNNNMLKLNKKSKMETFIEAENCFKQEMVRTHEENSLEKVLCIQDQTSRHTKIDGVSVWSGQLIKMPNSTLNSLDSVKNLFCMSNNTSDTHVVSNTNHDTTHKVVMHHQCPVCHKNFGNQEVMSAHARAHLLQPDTWGKFCCQKCPKTFVSRYRLNEHIRIHTKEKPYQCNVCKKRFHKYALLSQHTAIHEINGMYQCSVCDARFPRKGNMRQHLCIHYRGEKKMKVMQLTCRVCFRTLPSLRHLSLHNTEVHSSCDNDNTDMGMTGSDCPFCRESLPNDAALNNHIKTIHVDSYICGVCEERVKGNVLAWRHLQRHVQNSRPCCSFCSRTFKTMEQRVFHEQSHKSESALECSHCGQFFCSRRTLRKHIKIHSTDREYHCTECGKSFKRNDTLINHYRIHTGERPFSCKFCGFAFKQRGDCTKHERNHDKHSDAVVRQTVKKKVL